MIANELLADYVQDLLRYLPSKYPYVPQNSNVQEQSNLEQGEADCLTQVSQFVQRVLVKWFEDVGLLYIENLETYVTPHADVYFAGRCV